MKVETFIKMFKNNNYEKTDIKTYQCLIKKLIYLLYNIRSNIVFIIGHLSKQNTNLKVNFLKVVKQVLKYFKRTIYVEITYKAGKLKAFLYKSIKYANSNYIQDLKDCKSVIEYYFLINRIIIF